MRDGALEFSGDDPRDKAWPVWLRSLEMVDTINHEAMLAKREGRSAKFDCDPHVAFLMADAMLHYADLKMPLLRAMVDIEENIIKSAAVADQMMHDEVTRFAYCIADLEILLENFLGRPAMSLQEIRERQRDAVPTVRERHPRNTLAASEELRRSVRSGRIGDPREPGQEG